MEFLLQEAANVDKPYFDSVQLVIDILKNQYEVHGVDGFLRNSTAANDVSLQVSSYKLKPWPGLTIR